jgi:hypothetical protein
MKVLVYIRVEQLKSLLKDPYNPRMYRFVPFVLLFIVCALTIWTHNPMIYFIIHFIFLLLIHVFRNDYKLLKKMGLSVYTIIFTEYFCLSLPVITAGIVFQQPIGIAILMTYLLLLPCTQPDRLFHFRHFFNQNQ